MAHRFGAGFEAYWRSQGMAFIDLEEGLNALGELMAPASPGAIRLAHYGFLPADWQAYARARGARLPQPLAVSLVETTRPRAAPSSATGASGAALSPLTQELLPLAPTARVRRMEGLLQQVLGELLEMPEAEATSLDFSQPVVELGLTSMHVISLVSQLGEVTGLTLSPTLMYEAVSLHALSEVLLGMLALGDGEASATQEQRAVGERKVRLVVAGLACRLPGADTPADFWANLQRGADAVVPPPPDRPHNGRDSGYLSQQILMGFDAARFGVGGREAALIDPQQRLLLHAAYEAFLDAGLPPDQLADRSVGVFVGISQIEYASLAQACHGM